LLLTPFYHGLGNRWIVVPLFLLTLTAAGMFYGYLRLITDSVWPAALAHSSFNAFWDLFSRLTIAVSPLALEYFAGETGVFTLVGTAVVSGWLVYRLDRRAARFTAYVEHAARA
jgi:membrane protease YdiL (CAAX protease family)